MNVRSARELLFGEDRVKLGDALASLARISDCSPDLCGGEFNVSKTLGSMARTGRSVSFSGDGQGQFQIIFQKRGHTFDDTPYIAHVDFDAMRSKFGGEATDIGHWARFDFMLTQRVGDNAVQAYDQVVLLEGPQILDSVTYSCLSGIVRVAFGDSLDDRGVCPLDDKAVAAFGRITDDVSPDFSRHSRQPFASSFAEAVTLLAPSFKP